MTETTFFRSPENLRAWFEQNHATATELHAGFYKKGSGEPSVTWPDSVDEALCVGWIDGVRRNVDERRYTIRFTPRKKGSIWSAVNIRKAEALIREGRMLPAGLKAYEARRENSRRDLCLRAAASRIAGAVPEDCPGERGGVGVFPRAAAGLPQKDAWRIVSAKQEATRLKRLEQLLAASAQGRRLS